MTEEREPTDTRYRRAFRRADVPVLVTTDGFEIVDSTDACLRLIALERAELIGRKPADLLERRQRFVPVRTTLERGGVWQGELELRTGSGQCVPVACTARPIEWADPGIDAGAEADTAADACASAETRAEGSDAGYVFTFRDRTRQRQYEQGVRIFDRVLRHNLRNDANVVLGHLENALTVADEETEESLNAAIRGVERLARHGDTARSFSDVFSGDCSPLGPTPLAGTVERAVAIADTRDADVEVDVPSVSVIANDTLQPAIRELVENATTHNDHEDPWVRVSGRYDGDRIVLRVADNGPGVDPTHYDRVFGREERSQLDHGDGLSLFFVDRLMELYGGRARVERSDRGGAAFELVFRPADVDSDAEGDPDA